MLQEPRHAGKLIDVERALILFTRVCCSHPGKYLFYHLKKSVIWFKVSQNVLFGFENKITAAESAVSCAFCAMNEFKLVCKIHVRKVSLTALSVSRTQQICTCLHAIVWPPTAQLHN